VRAQRFDCAGYTTAELHDSAQRFIQGWSNQAIFVCGGQVVAD
jgi:hypothetical protein